ncbi:hypothetical protein HDC91_003706 [Mucilaginibacter sp. AK015]|nr:hypothetical protein [Mucilaginibacter sp. AK015]
MAFLYRLLFYLSIMNPIIAIGYVIIFTLIHQFTKKWMANGLPASVYYSLFVLFAAVFVILTLILLMIFSGVHC